MRKSTVLAIIILIAAVCQLYGQDNREIAEAKLQLAIKLMDDGVYDESIALLDEAALLDPEPYIYTYEKAYAYYLMEDYATAISLLKKCLKHDYVTDLVYQLMGNAYDMSGDPKKALQAYARGLKKFPNSGRLYLESGVVYNNQGDYSSAMSRFEKGIEVDPYYPSNYFHAAYLYLNSANKGTGMIYGEMFMNLERNSNRTKKMSGWLYNGYKDNITFSDDSTVVLNFSDKFISLSGNPMNFKLPLAIIYELGMGVATLDESTVDMSSLSRIRTVFLEWWFNDRAYKHPLFDYQRTIAEAGHFEAYTYWLLMQGDGKAFARWHGDNEEKYTAFTDWFIENGMAAVNE